MKENVYKFSIDYVLNGEVTSNYDFFMYIQDRDRPMIEERLRNNPSYNFQQFFHEFPKYWWKFSRYDWLGADILLMYNNANYVTKAKTLEDVPTFFSDHSSTLNILDKESNYYGKVYWPYANQELVPYDITVKATWFFRFNNNKQKYHIIVGMMSDSEGRAKEHCYNLLMDKQDFQYGGRIQTFDYKKMLIVGSHQSTNIQVNKLELVYEEMCRIQHFFQDLEEEIGFGKNECVFYSDCCASSMKQLLKNMLDYTKETIPEEGILFDNPNYKRGNERKLSYYVVCSGEENICCYCMVAAESPKDAKNSFATALKQMGIKADTKKMGTSNWWKFEDMITWCQPEEALRKGGNRERFLKDAKPKQMSKYPLANIYYKKLKAICELFN